MTPIDHIRTQVVAAIAASDFDTVRSLAEPARAERQTALDTILVRSEGAGRGNLLASEQRQFDALRAEIHELDNHVETCDAEGRRQFVEVRDQHLAARRASQRSADQWAGTAPDPTSVGRVAQVRSEPHTYHAGSDQRGVSFFADVAAAAQGSHDPRLHERLERHVHEAIVDGRIQQGGTESRDVGTSAFTGLVVPQYLTDMVAPLARAMAPTVAIANRHDLPPAGMTVNISRITTGTAVGAQSAEGDAATETNADDTLLTVPVRTYAGMQDISRQAVDRGTGVDDVLMQDLTAAYWTKVDADVLNGAGTNGTHLGILATSNIESVIYASGTPSAVELWPKFGQLISEIQSGVFMGVSHFVMAPRRWWWLASRTGTDRPFLGVEGAGDQGGKIGGTEYFANDRQIFGVPVILDGNVPLTNGGATNEDVILAVTDRELHYWDEGGPRFIRAEQTLAANLQVRFVLFGYSAWTAGRQPGAHGTISSTGLVEPSFG